MLLLLRNIYLCKKFRWTCLARQRSQPCRQSRALARPARRWAGDRCTSTPASRVVDPYWFNADPDQAFFQIADSDPDPVPNPGFWWLKNWKNLQLKKIGYFFYLKKLQSFSPQKRTFSTSKHENSLLFSIFVGHFCPPGSGSGSGSSNSN